MSLSRLGGGGGGKGRCGWWRPLVWLVEEGEDALSIPEHRTAGGGRGGGGEGKGIPLRSQAARRREFFS